MKEIKKLNPFGRFCCTIGNLPSSYMLSLTYEEQLLWLCNYLETTVIPAINNNAEALEEVQRLFVELKDYVDNYLDNLDIQQDVNDKLDEMAEDGTLERIIGEGVLNSKVNTFNQDSALNRIYRLITTYTKVGAIHHFNNKVYMSVDNDTTSRLYKLNETTYAIEGYADFAYVITDISNYENNLIICNNTNTIYSLDKDTLLGVDSIILDINVKFCEYDVTNEIYYIVDDEYNFKTTDFDGVMSDYEFNKECKGIVIKNEELYLLQENEIELYNNKVLKRLYNTPLIVNNEYVKGTNNGICLMGEKFVIATYKTLMVHRNDYVISLYEMNLTKNVKDLKTLLNYNATTNDFEIHVDNTNTNVNPDGSTDNPFPNIYEALEVVYNSNYHKGSIMYDKSGETLDDVLITNSYKKISIVFNGATVNGMRIRNCSKIEIAGANFQDEYEDQEACLQVINSEIVIASDCTFTNSKSLNQVIKSEYGSKVSCLVGTGSGGILSSSGALTITRNNSLGDKKILGDRFGKFLPNFIQDSHTNFATGTITIDNLNWYSFIKFKINTQGNMSYVEIPAENGTYNIPTCVTIDSKLFVGNISLTISGNNLTINSKTLYNITDRVLNTTYTFRINNIWLLT